MLHRIKLTGIIFFFIATVGTLILYYLSKPMGFSWNSNILLIISQILSLIGTVYLSISFLLSSRFPFLEKMIGGLDIIYKIHHILGAISFMALLHHPLLLAVQKLPNTNLALRYFIPAENLAYNFGIFALGLMILLLILTLFVELPYHIWKKTHSWMGMVLLLGMIHVFFINSDVSRYMPLQLWMFFWMGLGGISFVYKYFLYNKYKDSYEYTIKNIKDMDTYVELILKPNHNKKMEYCSGQFLFLSTKNNQLDKESHPFSIASNPEDETITLFCKKLGDYTNKLNILKINEEVNINGPYGTFFETIPIKRKIIGIAGGIGITPFLSLIKNSKQLNNKDLTLFHVVRNKKDSFLSNTENNISKNIKTIIHESKTQGRFSISTLFTNVKDIKGITFYLCGPIGMMQSLRSQLLKVGVRPSKIIFEDFSFK